MIAELRLAVDAAHRASVEHDNQRARIRGLERDLPGARAGLDEAEQVLTACLGADELGEGSAAATKAARKARDEAAERVRGINAALSVLREREPDLAAQVRTLEESSRAAALPIAEKLAAEQLERCQRLFESAASSYAVWHELDTYLVGGELTGPAQSEKAGVAEIFRRHGVHARNGRIECGDGNGMARPMSARELLALLEPEQAEAAQ